MSIFEPNSTPADESPVIGHEEEAAEQFEDQEEFADDNEGEQVEADFQEEESDPEDGHSEEPQLIFGKYKTMDEATKAFKNLERQFHESRQKPQQQQPIEQQQQQEEQGLNLSDPNAIIDAINRDPVGTIAQISQLAYQQARTTETREQQFQNGMAEIVESYKDVIKSEDDFDPFFVKVKEISKEFGVNPRVASPRILRMAAQEVWGDTKSQSTAKLYNQAKEEVRKAADANRRQKQGLGAPTGAKPKETPKSAEELIADSIVSAGSRNGIFGR